MTSVEDFLEHHGVKGQKWGIRNAQIRKLSPEHKQATKLREKHLSELTNQELKTLNERLNLETNYNRLNPNVVRKGHGTAKEILAFIGTATSLAALLNSDKGRKLLRDGSRFIASKVFSNNVDKAIRNIAKDAIRLKK